MTDAYTLVTRNLQEIIGEEQLREKLDSGSFTIYWGTAPTGAPHVAYFLPLMKVADYLKAGLSVKILFADLHAALDIGNWDLVGKRTAYYEAAIKAMLKSIGVDLSNLTFVKGSAYQLSAAYVEDLFKLSTIVSVHDAQKAGSEVVKQSDNPKLSGLIYPLMQVLDEQYLDVDAQFGGVDQRKILVCARENLPKLGYSARIELMNPMIPGLTGDKMSASNEASKVDILDSAKVVAKKINKADCVAGDPNNGLMSFAKYVIFTKLNDEGVDFVVDRPEKFGGNLSFSSYEELETAFVDKSLHPMDLKSAVAKYIDLFLDPIRKDESLHQLREEAYGSS